MENETTPGPLTSIRPSSKGQRALAYAVRQRVEAAVRASMELDPQTLRRRELQRDAYRRIFPEGEGAVDFAAVRGRIEEAVSACLHAWREVMGLDLVALGDAAGREEFDLLEQLVNRAIHRLGGIRDALGQAKGFATFTKTRKRA